MDSNRGQEVIIYLDNILKALTVQKIPVQIHSELVANLIITIPINLMDLFAMVEARGNSLVIMVTVIMEIKDLPHSLIIFPRRNHCRIGRLLEERKETPEENKIVLL